MRLQTAVCLAAACSLVCAHATAQDAPATVGPVPWLKVGAELRARAEMESLSISGEEDGGFAHLARVRLSARVDPAAWFRFTLNLQDARTLTGRLDTLLPTHDNHVDVQHAFAEFGAGEHGRWNVRVGRQPLAFGDERLVGADGFWCNRSQRFDGGRVMWQRGSWRWDVFSAAPVEVVTNVPDPINRRETLSGVYGKWSKQGGATVEPYVFWKRARPLQTGGAAPYDLWTPGLRANAPVALGLELTTEMAAQRGRVASATVGAWAGYWEIARHLAYSDTSPRLVFSFSRASGADGSPGRVGTFNDLNPAAYNSCGFLEPFSWRNIRDLRAGGEFSLPKRWQLTADVHRYWLATVKDGVYVDEGPYVAFDPSAPSSSLGTRVLASARRTFTTHFELAFGYARFLPGAYMKKGISLSHSAYLSWTVHI